MKKLCLTLLFLFLAAPLSAQTVTLSTLLDEMIDRDSVTRFPEPAFFCLQASSYERLSTAPDAPHWFANADYSQFVREEMNGDRKEWVLMDAEGPGAIVRWWVTVPQHNDAVFRIYLDGSDTPTIEAPFEQLVGGNVLVEAPLSAVKAAGRNLYLPIPYAKRCKVTVDNMPGQRQLYYIINYRAYAEGTQVETFTMDGFKSLKEKIDSVQKTLLAAGDELPTALDRPSTVIPKGGSPVLMFEKTLDTTAADTGLRRPILNRQNRRNVSAPRAASEGTGEALQYIALKVDDECEEELARALRSTVLSISFDGKETVWCPLGDFFGSGVGINPYKSWNTRVEKDGTMLALWRMPFQRSVKVSLINYGTEDVKVAKNSFSTAPYHWDSRSMYFHANWQQEREINTRPYSDWNYITIKGRGVFVGDVLAVLNRTPAWWGEGDEKIYVDGETFPSHFGTGTEDYYGYAWCLAEFFEAPFHFQPRAEGPGNYGNVTNGRVRSLDGIPFTKDFRFDMEVHHWIQTKVDYAVAAFWYGFDGAELVGFQSRKDQMAEVQAPVLYKSPMMLDIPGFNIEKVPTGGVIQNQGMGGFSRDDRKWHNNDHLWWTGGRPGDKLELILETEKEGQYKFVAELTKARDYGIIQFSINGEKVGLPIDLYNPDVAPTGAIEVGTVDLKSGKQIVEIEIVGKNDAAVAHMVGVDILRLVP